MLKLSSAPRPPSRRFATHFPWNIVSDAQAETRKRLYCTHNMFHVNVQYYRDQSYHLVGL